MGVVAPVSRVQDRLTRSPGLGARISDGRFSCLRTALPLLVAFSLLAGCSTRFVRGRAERRIAHKLDDLIGPAERYQVRVRGTKDAEIVAGRLRRIDVDGWNVHAGNQIDLESFHLELHELRYHAP